MVRQAIRTAVILLSGTMATPSLGAAMLQCVPYARIVSGVEIRGDALTWWDQAEGLYKRGNKPKKGAVLAFRPYGPMALGHVAVVSRILDDRRVLIRHANWSAPGAIEEDVLALDVSSEGDWSQVRVWYSPTGQMGARTNPTYGFIYPAKAKLHDFTPDPALGDSIRFANVDRRDWDAVAAGPRSDTLRRMPVLALGRTPPAPGKRRNSAPRLEADLSIARYAEAVPAERTLSAIIADVKREAVLN